MVLSDLNEGEKSFRSLAENLPGIVYRVLIEDDNRMKFFNGMVQTMTGYNPEDLKRGDVCSLTPLIIPEDRFYVIKIVKDAIENNIPFEVEYRINDKSGDLKWFFERGRPIRGDKGNPIYIDGVIFDITKRKETEKKLKTYEESLERLNKELEKSLNERTIRLRESEKKFKILFNESPIGIELYDYNGKLVDLNKSCLDIFGVSSIDNVSDFELFKDPNIPKKLLKNLKKGHIIRHEILFNFDLVKDLNLYDTRKSGKIWIDLLISPLYFEENNTISNYLVQIQDITERKIAEQKLKVLNKELDNRVHERTKQLKESEIRYKSLADELEVILDHIPGVVVYKDTENNILRVNKFLADSHNLKKSEMENRSSFDFYSRDIAQAYWEDDLEVINNKKPKINIVEPWEVGAGKRCVNTSKIPYIDENGNVKGIIAIKFDITERMLAIQKLKESKEKYKKEKTVLNNIINLNPYAIATFDSEGHNIRRNQAFINFFKSVPPKDYIFFEDPIIKKAGYENELIKAKKGDNVLFPEVWYDPHLYDPQYPSVHLCFRMMMFPIFSHNGNNIENYIIMVEDITERKKAEEALLESEERFRNLIEQSLDGVVLIDESGLIIEWNEGQEQITGLKKEDVLGKTIWDIQFQLISDEKKSIKQFKMNNKAIKDVFISNNAPWLGKKRDVNIQRPDNKKILTIQQLPFLIKTKNKTMIGNFNRDITEQKQIQIELRESEKLLKSAQELAQVGHWKLDPSTMEVTGSDELFRIFGFTHNEVTLEKFSEVVHPEDREMELYHIRRGIEKGESWNIEYRVISKDGKEKWVHALGEAIKDDDDKVVMVMGTVQDITVRKKMMEELRIKDIVFNSSLSGQITSDINGVIDHVNPAFLKLWGYKSKKEAIGKSVSSFFANPGDVIPIVEKLNETGNWEGEFLAKRHDGSTFKSQAFASVIYNEKGEMIGFQSANLNITKRKEAEQKVKNEKENAQKYLDIAGVIIVALDADQTVQLINQKGCEILEVEQSKIIGMNWFDNYIPKNVREQVKNDFNRILNGEIELLEHYENEVITKNGKNRIISWHNHILKDQAGKIIGTLSSGQDITVRKQAELKLKISKEKFRKQNIFLNNILESLTHPFYVINAKDYKVVLANSTASSEGLEKEEYCYSLTHRNNGPCKAPCVCPLNKVKNTKKSCVVEHTHYDKEGNEKNYEIFGYPILDENGNVVQMIEYALNVTDRKKAQQELKKSEEKYRHLFENSPYYIILLDKSGNFIDCNNSAVDIFGYYKEDLIGYNFRELSIIPPELLPLIENNIELLIKGELIPHLEFIPIRKDGKKIWINAQASLIKLDRELFIYIIGQDITERKKAERKLKESEENSRFLAHQWRTTFDAMSESVFLLDLERNILQCNKSTLDFLGKKDYDEIIGHSCCEIVHGTIEPIEWCPMKRTIESSNRESSIAQIGDRWFEISVDPVINDEGTLIGAVHIIADITEKKEAEQELIKLSNLKSELLSRTSHELKTPLVSIKGFTDILLELYSDKLDDYVKKTLKQIKKGCTRLESLVYDILKAAELKSGTLELKKSKDDLSFLIKMVVSEFEGMLELRNHTINLDILDKLICSFEREQIFNVVANIISNAIKYTPYNGKIEVKSEIKDGFIIISVKDNGIGFSKEEKSLIFKQFGKIERYGQGYDVLSEGSGLGLYISKKIIEMHGGEIWLESEGRNKGSTIYFSLPIV